MLTLTRTHVTHFQAELMNKLPLLINTALPKITHAHTHTYTRILLESKIIQQQRGEQSDPRDINKIPITFHSLLLPSRPPHLYTYNTRACVYIYTRSAAAPSFIFSRADSFYRGYVPLSPSIARLLLFRHTHTPRDSSAHARKHLQPLLRRAYIYNIILVRSIDRPPITRTSIHTARVFYAHACIYTGVCILIRCTRRPRSFFISRGKSTSCHEPLLSLSLSLSRWRAGQTAINVFINSITAILPRMYI